MPSFPCFLVTAISLLSLLYASPCLAQFPRPFANLTTFTSPVDPNITVSYKVPRNVCATVFDTQQQYTGWVNVPGDFPTNIFFWFVSAREPTSQLTVWLNGGPGSGSMFGFFDEVGPCEVVEKGANQLDTAARTWGWDRASNMLFIDQPNQVGFSYDTPTNGSLNLVTSNWTFGPEPVPHSLTPAVFLNGTFASMNSSHTPNTTQIAAKAIWHMMQGFLSAFPEYNPPGDSSLGVNLFGESYGGRYAPIYAETWEEENARLVESFNTTTNTTNTNVTGIDIHLVSVGIVNGCVDDLVQGPHYVSMAVNNSYGLQLLSPVYAALANGSFYNENGCRDLILQCRTAVLVSDPDNLGNVEEVSSICRAAQTQCESQLYGPYSESGRSVYDIAHYTPDAFPASTYIEYLNTRKVQEAIGAVINYTDTNAAVNTAFRSTGDMERGETLPALATLLASGVRVGLIYGDRDYICNWMGGEAVSLDIANRVGGDYAFRFPITGYAPIIVNDSYIGGVVRQYGNLSFSRVYQSGHFVPASQPETAFQIFARIIMGNSVSTGEAVDLAAYNTTGELNATETLELPDSPTPTCYLRAIPSSCPQTQVDALLKGEGVVVNGVWYSAYSDWPGATVTSSADGSSSTTASSASQTLTGLFTATATPKSGVVRSADARGSLGVVVLCMVAAVAGLFYA
ncbi:putative carboxypeptidase s1 protein [Phaeoacremonium minimum UCRPA7]|uniref:Carboxypeptidase n=1 Tax=Phaeoacremonium minimum (strain UCR-PA7) TaxID=1286976 RepID=R8BR42_PHAM7|nr:putative carboxypeptidase s1 protein [Phaeoacremonium minimum UCRPA7]EOO01817.1 putative carboxypeptidase s1 protein [Phaeoacremonium minimum UCRPA7]